MERLYRKLASYDQEDVYPFHMPGHKRNPAVMGSFFPGGQDITEITGFDNLHHPEGILLEASRHAAQVYGSRFTFLGVNGSTGMILSAMQVFFNDTSYFYDIVIILLRYLSAIFYDIARFPEQVQRYFLFNPVYAFIKYFRIVVIDQHIPSLSYHLLLLLYTALAVAIGGIVYKKNNRRFAYYL